MHIICSDEYLSKQVLDRLDPALEAQLKKRRVANLELFPPFREAVGLHFSVDGVAVGKPARDDDHLATMQGADRLLSQAQGHDCQSQSKAIANKTPVDYHGTGVPW